MCGIPMFLIIYIFVFVILMLIAYFHQYIAHKKSGRQKSLCMFILLELVLSFSLTKSLEFSWYLTSALVLGLYLTIGFSIDCLTITVLSLAFRMLLLSMLWCCLLGSRKGIQLVKKLSGGMLVWLCVWVKVQIAYGPADVTAIHYLLVQ